MTGARILVVGGGLGIGALVTEYLVNKHGAKVVVLGLDVSKSIALLEAEGNIRIVRGDATNVNVQQQTMKVVTEYLGGLDSLIITLGIITPIEIVARLDMSEMRKTFEVNLFAPVALTQQYLPILRKSKGHLIILSSAVDRDVTWSAWSPYSSSKAALTRFIEILGREEDEVKVYGVYPGLTKTNMVTDLIAGKFAGKMKDHEVEFFIQQEKEGKVEPPEWTANATAKLAVGAIEGNWHGKCVRYSELGPNYKDYDS